MHGARRENGSHVEGLGAGRDARVGPLFHFDLQPPAVFPHAV